MILDGNKIRDKRKELLKQKVLELSNTPKLAIIQIGDRPDSNSYIKRKIDFGAEIGVKVELFKFEENFGQDNLINEIEKLNQDESVNGMILQLPLPESYDANLITSKISLEKDVDGLNPSSKFLSATARGIFTLLEEYEINISGQKALVIGQSDLVGKPVAKKFSELGATVDTADINTQNLQEKTLDADIIVVAVGSPKLITKDFVKEGQVIIDVGINFVDGKLCGDVDFNEVEPIVHAISPVPGGVGPMTVLSLFENLISN